jgi:hypothetical protein
VEARPGREGGIGAPRTHDVEGDFGIGEELVPEVVREIWVGAKQDRDKVILPVLTALSAGLDLWVCGGTNVTGKRCERKYSRHSNEVSLSTMRLGRGWEWAVKKARIDAKEKT